MPLEVGYGRVAGASVSVCMPIVSLHVCVCMGVCVCLSVSEWMCPYAWSLSNQVLLACACGSSREAVASVSACISDVCPCVFVCVCGCGASGFCLVHVCLHVCVFVLRCLRVSVYVSVHICQLCVCVCLWLCRCGGVVDVSRWMRPCAWCLSDQVLLACL